MADNYEITDEFLDIEHTFTLNLQALVEFTGLKLVILSFISIKLLLVNFVSLQQYHFKTLRYN